MSLLAAAAGVSLLSSGISAVMSNRKAKSSSRAAKRYEQMLADLEANRQDVINPYANVTNPFENLQVATGAANFQAEENDIALANTLDTLRASGYSAGGATALAQAALRGKQDIASSIEAQEVRNAELRARGQQQMEQLQGQGAMFQFNAQEARENQRLARLAGLGQENRRLAAGYNQQTINSISGGLENLSGILGGIGMGMNE